MPAIIQLEKLLIVNQLLNYKISVISMVIIVRVCLNGVHYSSINQSQGNIYVCYFAHRVCFKLSMK